MEERKTNYKDIVIVVLAVILVILIVLLINKLRNSKETEIVTSDYNTFDLSDCVNGSCNKEFIFNDNVINVLKNSDKSYEIKYNDFTILASVDKPYIGDSIYTFKDTVIYTTKDEDGFLSIYKYDFGDPESTKIELSEENWFIDKINVENEKVTVYTTRFNKDNFFDDNNKVFVSIAKCFEFNEFKDRIAEQTFEFSYSDGKFTDIKSIGTKKLSEFSEYSKLCANGGE